MEKIMTRAKVELLVRNFLQQNKIEFLDLDYHVSSISKKINFYKSRR